MTETENTDLIEDLKDQNLTAKELLTQINNAISTVATTGVSYKIGSRSVTRSSISELKKLRNELLAEIANEKDTGLMRDTYVAFFDGR